MDLVHRRSASDSPPLLCQPHSVHYGPSVALAAAADGFDCQEVSSFPITGE